MTEKPTQNMFVDEESVKQAKEQPAKQEPQPEVGSSDHNILKLPSKGQLGYPAEVEYREIMLADSETLSLATADTYAKTLNAVLKGILNDCSFFEDLTIFDRDYALVWIWSNNYDSVKHVDVKCSHCGNKDTHKVDLLKLEIEEIKDKFKTPFPMKIKKLDEPIQLRLVTVRDEMLVEEYMKKNPDSNIETIMVISAIETGIEVPLQAKVEWAKNKITSAEMQKIKAFHKFFKFGVPTTLEHTCTECGEVTRGLIPFQTEDVLFPTVSGDFEDFL